MTKHYYTLTEDLFLYEGAEGYETIKPSEVGTSEEDEDIITLKKGTVLTADFDDAFGTSGEEGKIPLRKLTGEISMWIDRDEFYKKHLESMNQSMPITLRPSLSLFVARSELGFNWQTGGLYEAEILFRASDEDGHPRFNWDLFFKTKDDPDPEGNPIVDYCEVNYMDDKNWPSGDERHNFNSFSEAMAFVKEDAKKRGIKV